MEILTVFFMFTTKINLKALRNLRVLRPLKSINAIPSMRRLVGTLISSMPKLLNVLFFFAFIFTLFGIMGLQLYSGKIYNKCRLTEQPINETYWPKSDDYPRSCSQVPHIGYQCPEGLYCGGPSQFNISLKDDGVYED